MGKPYTKKNKLTKTEMGSGAFKVLKDENNSLKKTLISTQNELERYRSRYHEVDKENGIYRSMKQTVVFHELIKFLSTGILGSLSINMLTEKKYSYAFVLLIIAIIIYTVVVKIDNKIFNKETSKN